MSKPPGVPSVDGPIVVRKRAILSARLGVARLGASRLGFAPVDVDNSVAVGFVKSWRSDPEPGTYGGAYAGTRVVE